MRRPDACPEYVRIENLPSLRGNQVHAVRWTTAEIIALVKMREMGFSFKEIARELGTSIKKCREKYSETTGKEESDEEIGKMDHGDRPAGDTDRGGGGCI